MGGSETVFCVCVSLCNPCVGSAWCIPFLSVILLLRPDWAEWNSPWGAQELSDVYAHTDTLSRSLTLTHTKNVQLRALTARLKATFQCGGGMFCSSWAEIWPLGVDRSVPVGFKSVLFWSRWSAFCLSFSLSFASWVSLSLSSRLLWTRMVLPVSVACWTN